ncbi:class I SAM-dependent methyltransferase [Paenibacillus flagellatus]|uniref:Uncharacterized protein n=1 Tax=Paenibacillus flagellatus TaxID=2211139 RepID=A0A2V5K2N5_9BACL|nr:class I SAM-dependent methyltransferase [Paenibacillus flagellatus]PYI53431.1 hypothetical protein DLM86_16785 [Paenibacillus flagellatus]
MSISIRFEKLLERQFVHNEGKSLFYEKPDGEPPLTPAEHTVRFLQKHGGRFVDWVRSAAEADDLRPLLRKLARSCMTSFMKANPYVHFQAAHHAELERLYRRSLQEICGTLVRREFLAERDLVECFRCHYARLRSFLSRTNGTELFRAYARSPHIPPIAYAEYSPELQLNVLGLHEDRLLQPILDIGCGAQARLIRYLREYGLAASGLDRWEVECGAAWSSADWLYADYGTGVWGTVISHMAFSNHFRHHHLRKDGLAEDYARAYMNIVRSLRPGGCFAYAPGLPFMEEPLARDPRFRIETQPVVGALEATRVIRIR